MATGYPAPKTQVRVRGIKYLRVQGLDFVWTVHEPEPQWRESNPRSPNTASILWTILEFNLSCAATTTGEHSRAKVEDARPIQRHFITSIPGVGQYTVSRDDRRIAWRGNDINGKRTTLYFPRICSMEFKKAPTDYFPQVAAQLEGLFLETALFAAMDFDEPESINRLTEQERTMYVYN